MTRRSHDTRGCVGHNRHVDKGLLHTCLPLRRKARTGALLGFVALSGLALSFLVYFAGTWCSLFVLVPILVLAIYLFPGHGESLPPADVRVCLRCGHRVDQKPGGGTWQCPA